MPTLHSGDGMLWNNSASWWTDYFKDLLNPTGTLSLVEAEPRDEEDNGWVVHCSGLNTLQWEDEVHSEILKALFGEACQLYPSEHPLGDAPTVCGDWSIAMGHLLP